ncbi:hypothetical protein, partial [Mycobacterium sp. E2462]|uniref:hypothetical protein n=1 Tax=Mycobacterium sp. E2462 TaxID=1834133 RepID=UPI000AB2E38D
MRTELPAERLQRILVVSFVLGRGVITVTGCRVGGRGPDVEVRLGAEPALQPLGGKFRSHGPTVGPPPVVIRAS